jgi:hypothetical protein
MIVRLIRKLADRLDGIDLSLCNEGDAIDLSRRDAELLVAEGWASRCAPRQSSLRGMPAIAADAPTRRRTLEQLRRIRKEMETRHLEQQEQRRAEDCIREERHDAHARIVTPASR